jgi:hypothetical protein
LLVTLFSLQLLFQKDQIDRAHKLSGFSFTQFWSVADGWDYIQNFAKRLQIFGSSDLQENPGTIAGGDSRREMLAGQAGYEDL